jgi:hypothetical protein
MHCLLIAVQKSVQEKIAKQNKLVFRNRLLYNSNTDFCPTFLGLRAVFSDSDKKFRCQNIKIQCRIAFELNGLRRQKHITGQFRFSHNKEIRIASMFCEILVVKIVHQLTFCMI